MRLRVIACDRRGRFNTNTKETSAHSVPVVVVVDLARGNWPWAGCSHAFVGLCSSGRVGGRCANGRERQGHTETGLHVGGGGGGGRGGQNTQRAHLSPCNGESLKIYADPARLDALDCARVVHGASLLCEGAHFHPGPELQGVTQRMQLQTSVTRGVRLCAQCLVAGPKQGAPTGRRTTHTHITRACTPDAAGNAGRGGGRVGGGGRQNEEQSSRKHGEGAANDAQVGQPIQQSTNNEKTDGGTCAMVGATSATMSRVVSHAELLVSLYGRNLYCVSSLAAPDLRGRTSPAPTWITKHSQGRLVQPTCLTESPFCSKACRCHHLPTASTPRSRAQGTRTAAPRLRRVGTQSREKCASPRKLWRRLRKSLTTSRPANHRAMPQPVSCKAV